MPRAASRYSKPLRPPPKKKPKPSIKRFEALQPNEALQSNLTHWRLADGTDIEIINWLDDHSRLLLSLHAYSRVTGDIVIDTFAENINEYGPPQSTLSDNGTVYTARFTRLDRLARSAKDLLELASELEVRGL